MLNETLLPRSKTLVVTCLLILLASLFFLLPERTAQAAPPPPAAVSAFTEIDTVIPIHNAASLVVNAQGFPVIAYYDRVDDIGQSSELKLAVCRDSECIVRAMRTLDDTGAGRNPSLKLDSNGFPVIVHQRSGGLKLTVCNDADCSIPSTTSIPFTSEGEQPSLVLTDDDRPIISYYDESQSSLNIVVCDTSTCDNPDEITVDNAGDVGQYSSIALNSSGLPVISYFDLGTWDVAKNDLKIAVCNDIACDNPAKLTVDSVGQVGRYSSLALNSLGNPVISYYDTSNGDLKVAFCEDAICGFKTIVTVDSVGIVGYKTSLVLNNSGFPVISYIDVTNRTTKVAVCTDDLCSNPTLTSIDPLDGASYTGNTSLGLDSSGIPFISYFDEAGEEVKMAMCVMCVTPELATVVSPGSVGSHTSLALQTNGNPIISYIEVNTALKVAICDDPLCTSRTLTTVDDSGKLEDTSLALSSNGHPVISYYDITDHDLELAICKNRTCTNRILTTVDSEGRQGKDSSLVLNSQGFAVISYYDETDFDLKVAVCNDADCTAPSINVVDGAASFVGDHSSMVLDSRGFPVISYYSLTGNDLKVATCNDAECETPATIRSAATAGSVGKHTSLALSSAGFPVISFYDETEDDLMLTVCKDAVCNQGTAPTRVDTPGDMGRYTSLALTSSNTPIISYFDNTNDDLKVVVCNDERCTSSTSTVVDQKDLVGDYGSLALNADGYPVISYYDGSPNANLKLAVFEPPTVVYTVNIPLVMHEN